MRQDLFSYFYFIFSLYLLSILYHVDSFIYPLFCSTVSPSVLLSDLYHVPFVYFLFFFLFPLCTFFFLFPMCTFCFVHHSLCLLSVFHFLYTIHFVIAERKEKCYLLMPIYMNIKKILKKINEDNLKMASAEWHVSSIILTKKCFIPIFSTM
jgi:hypothetical protein